MGDGITVAHAMKQAMTLPLYLDYNATTPIDPLVVDAMLPFLRHQFGNPSSGHCFGQLARDALTKAREQVAALVGVHSSQVVFTSGGTEANNLAIKGVAARYPGPLAISAIEHSSVQSPAAMLQQGGRDIAIIGVNAEGIATEHTLRQALESLNAMPAFVSVMLANNETGALQDVPMISGVLRESSAIIHTDAVQAVGKIDVDFNALGVHMLSMSAHKIYGPKGVGALVFDKRVDWEPLFHGGGQEQGLRPGTENVAGIVGFGKAAELAKSDLQQRQQHLLALRQYLETRLQQELPEAIVFSSKVERLPNTVFLALPGIDGETLLINLDQTGIAVSSGSACESASLEPSHVLMAMGVEQSIARCAIRVSMGKDTTREDIEELIRQLKQHAKTLHGMAAIAAI